MRAFDALKEAMSVFTKEFVVATDVSCSRLGVVLIQEGHPIAFISKALSITNKEKSLYAKIE